MEETAAQLRRLNSARQSVIRLSSIASSLHLDKDNPYHEQLIFQMLNIPDQLRNRQIRQALSDWLDQVEFFNQLKHSHSEQYVKKFISALTAESFKQGQLMIKTGDQSLFFYVMLTGSVMVLYPRAKADIEEDAKSIDLVETKKITLRERINKRFENHQHFKGVPVTSITNFERYFNQFGIPIFSVENVLQKGRGFGQLGILYKTRRMADIICQYDCVVAKISREKYLKIVGQESQKRIYARLQFLGKHMASHIGNMSRSEAQRYLYMFEQVDWKVNTIIFEIDTPVKGLFLITQGCVTLKTQKIESVEQDSRSIQRYGIFKSNKKKRLIAFKQLGAGQSFGLEQFINTGQQSGLRYNYEASTNTKSKILYCSLAKLLPILRIDKQLQRQLKANFQMKQSLSPIKQVISPEARLQSYSQAQTTRPQYRIMPLISVQSNVIRSPRSHSFRNLKPDTVAGSYKNSILHTESCQKQKSKTKVMSKALQLCAMEEIANNFRKKMKEWKKVKSNLADTNNAVEKHLDRKHMERIAKHMRLV